MKMRILYAPEGNTDGGAGGAGGSGVTDDPAGGEKFNNFKDDLPENQRAYTSMKDIDTVEKLVESHDHAQRMIGKSRMEIPGEGAKPEDWDSYYKSGGRPDGDAGSGYKLFDGETPKLPDGVVRNENMEKWFKEKAFSRGLSQSQARGTYEDFLEFQGSAAKATTETTDATYAEWDATIKKDFGAAYDQNMDIARQFVKNNGTPEFVKMLNDTGLASHPEMIKFCHQVGKHTIEHHSAGAGDRGSSGALLTPEQARGEITKLQSDPAFMKSYNTVENPTAHTAATAKMQELFKQAYPTAEE